MKQAIPHSHNLLADQLNGRSSNRDRARTNPLWCLSCVTEARQETNN